MTGSAADLGKPTAAAGGDSLVALRSRAGVAVIAATVLASLIGFLDASVVNVAVPAIGRSLHASVASLQWTLTSYLLAVAALLLLSGALADHFGRRRVLAAGLLVMLAASVLCAVAPSAGLLIAARVVQGAGAALVVPSSLALLNGTLRPGDRARGIGIWAGLATLGTTVGPYAGGWLTDHVSWRAVFLLNPPLVLAGLLVLWYVPDAGRARRPLSLDPAGALLAMAGLGGLIYALTAGPASGWLSAPVLITAITGVICLAALVAAERRRRAPMLRLSLFGSRQFDAINVMTVLLYGALYAAGYLVILQCELRLGYSAAQAGAALIPESVVFLAVAPVSGALVARTGPRWLMVAGILAAVGDTDLGEASAVNDAASRVGGLVVVGLVPVLIGAGGGRSLGHALAHGYQPAMLVMSALCAGAALVTGLFVSDSRAPAPPLAPSPRCHGCALPTPGPVPGHAATT